MYANNSEITGAPAIAIVAALSLVGNSTLHAEIYLGKAD